MIPSVREVLALPVVAAGKPRVIGGGEHLDHPVRWVHISESNDLTDLLEGGELVLSTGLPLAGSDSEIAEYLAMLGELRVAGLVVELGTHIDTAPEPLVAWADSTGVPIVVLDAAIRFVEVTEQVHRLIVADQYEEVEFARTTHEVFTSLDVSRASTTDIVTRASQILSAPLVLEDLGRHVLTYSTAGEDTARLLEAWAERSRLHDAAWSTVAVGVGVERWGRLILPAETASPSRARMVLERAAQSLQLHRMIQAERDALIVHALGGLLDDLLNGRITDDAEAQARAGSLGLSVHTGYVPLVVRVPRRADADALTQGEVDRRILTSVRQAVSAAGHTAIASTRHDATITAIMSCGTLGQADSALASVCAGLVDRLSTQDGTAGWVAGTAPASASLTAVAQGIAEAEHVAEVGLTMPQANRLYRSSDVRLRGLLALLRDDHRVQAFAETELGRLLAHDARTGETLLELLRTHLDCGGSKTQTARHTGLSRPTLYSRLRTIERILDVSLDSAESRTSLHTALMLVDARRARPTTS